MNMKKNLNKKKVEYVRIDGSTPEKHKHANVNSFQTNSKIKVAVLSITATYQGITLTEASVVVFAEYYWTPGIIIQAEDRAHRVGQKQSVTVYYLHADQKTIDSSMAKYIEEKDRVTSSVLNNATSEYQVTKVSVEVVKERIENSSKNTSILEEKKKSERLQDKSRLFYYLNNSSKKSQPKRSTECIPEDIDDTSSEELESEEQNSNEPIEEAKEQIEINPTFKEFYDSVKKGEKKFKDIPSYYELIKGCEFKNIDLSDKLEEEEISACQDSFESSVKTSGENVEWSVDLNSDDLNEVISDKSISVHEHSRNSKQTSSRRSHNFACDSKSQDQNICEEAIEEDSLCMKDLESLISSLSSSSHKRKRDMFNSDISERSFAQEKLTR